jgi:hypothetical protein
MRVDKLRVPESFPRDEEVVAGLSVVAVCGERL